MQSANHTLSRLSYTSFLETHAQPLVDLTLYVSSENYHAFTRPAYAHILHWPNTWLLPPQRRAAAKARTDHLNFSSLDLDTVDQEESETKKSQFATGSEIPKRLIRSTARTTGSLAKKKGQQAARFRLERLAEGCFTPLNRLLDGKTYLLSDGKGKGMTSLDCLALGYLALVLVPDVPQSWLKQMMKRKYPDLCGFVKEGARECWGLDLTDKERGGNDALTTTPTTTNLPYHPPTTSFNTTTLLLPLLSSLPLFGPFYRPPPLLYTSSSSPLANQNNHIPLLPTIILTLFTTTLVSGAYFLSTGELPPLDWVRGVRQRHGVVLRWPFGGRVQGRRLGDMGEAGRVLGVGMRGI